MENVEDIEQLAVHEKGVLKNLFLKQEKKKKKKKEIAYRAPSGRLLQPLQAGEPGPAPSGPSGAAWGPPWGEALLPLNREGPSPLPEPALKGRDKPNLAPHPPSPPQSGLINKFP